MTPAIAGAGLAGLLAAHAWPQATVFESEPAPRAHHRALLRFRSNAVAQLVGVEFREVTVRKGIWCGGEYVAPSIEHANNYSRKCLGRIEGDRSIWNLDPVQRWIAPENLYEQLVDAVDRRIRWGEPCGFDEPQPIVSTAPLPVVLKVLGLQSDEYQFHRAPIHVARYRVPKCNVYQTVYFPAPQTSVYRASITGDLLIVESTVLLSPEFVDPDRRLLEINDVMEAFAIYDVEPLDEGEQRYGKIVPLPDAQRRALLHKLTSEHHVYSLGRFATWRNVLLDDVVNDIAVIRRLLRASEYEHRLHFS